MTGVQTCALPISNALSLTKAKNTKPSVDKVFKLQSCEKLTIRDIQKNCYLFEFVEAARL